MRLQLERAQLVLGANRPLRLERAEGWCIECVRGAVWLTAAGEPEDRVLQAGDCHVLAEGGVVLVEALGKQEAAISLCRAAAASNRLQAQAIVAGFSGGLYANRLDPDRLRDSALHGTRQIRLYRAGFQWRL